MQGKFINTSVRFWSWSKSKYLDTSFFSQPSSYRRCFTSPTDFHSIKGNTPQIWTGKSLHLPLKHLTMAVRNSREESLTSQQGLHRRFCSTTNTSVKGKGQTWMDMKGNRPYWSTQCTTSTSFHLIQSLLLLLCASPRVLQSTIWAAKLKFNMIVNKCIQCFGQE